MLKQNVAQQSPPKAHRPWLHFERAPHHRSSCLPGPDAKDDPFTTQVQQVHPYWGVPDPPNTLRPGFARVKSCIISLEVASNPPRKSSKKSPKHSNPRRNVEEMSINMWEWFGIYDSEMSCTDRYMIHDTLVQKLNVNVDTIWLMPSLAVPQFWDLN